MELEGRTSLGAVHHTRADQGRESRGSAARSGRNGRSAAKLASIGRTCGCAARRKRSSKWRACEPNGMPCLQRCKSPWLACGSAPKMRRQWRSCLRSGRSHTAASDVPTSASNCARRNRSGPVRPCPRWPGFARVGGEARDEAACGAQRCELAVAAPQDVLHGGVVARERRPGCGSARRHDRRGSNAPRSRPQLRRPAGSCARRGGCGVGARRDLGVLANGRVGAWSLGRLGEGPFQAAAGSHAMVPLPCAGRR